MSIEPTPAQSPRPLDRAEQKMALDIALGYSARQCAKRWGCGVNVAAKIKRGETRPGVLAQALAWLAEDNEDSKVVLAAARRKAVGMLYEQLHATKLIVVPQSDRHPDGVVRVADHGTRAKAAHQLQVDYNSLEPAALPTQTHKILTVADVAADPYVGEAGQAGGRFSARSGHDDIGDPADN